MVELYLEIYPIELNEYRTGTALPLHLQSISLFRCTNRSLELAYSTSSTNGTCPPGFRLLDVTERGKM
jgi:hypothetical protein